MGSDDLCLSSYSRLVWEKTDELTCPIEESKFLRSLQRRLSRKMREENEEAGESVLKKKRKVIGGPYCQMIQKHSLGRSKFNFSMFSLISFFLVV